MSAFITGTDTGVGKTVFTTWLPSRLREEGLRCAGYKLISCGDRHDAQLLLTASSPCLTTDELNPVWLQTPAAPLAAAIKESRTIDPASLSTAFVRLTKRFDLSRSKAWAVGSCRLRFIIFPAISRDLQLPVIVVAHNRLGCLNHILLTVRGIEAAGLKCAGIRAERSWCLERPRLAEHR